MTIDQTYINSSFRGFGVNLNTAGMLKYILLGVFLIAFHQFSFSQDSSSKINYLKIAELEYDNGSLFLIQELRPKLERLDTTRGIQHRILLSQDEKDKFIHFVKELNLLSIQNNENHQEGYFPMEITYQKDGESQHISAYRSGMTPSEAASFDTYLDKIGTIIDFKQARKTLLGSLVDGQYQLRTLRRYVLRIGPSGWDSWEKQNGSIERLGLPLYFVNGKEYELDLLNNISPDSIESIEVTKGEEAEKKYGKRGINGVISITMK